MVDVAFGVVSGVVIRVVHLFRFMSHDNGPSIMDVILKESKNFNELWNIIRIRDPLCRDDLQLEV